MCDPTTVRSYLASSYALRRCIYPVDLKQRGVQMLEWPFPANMSCMDSVQLLLESLIDRRVALLGYWDVFLLLTSLLPKHRNRPLYQYQVSLQ